MNFVTKDEFLNSNNLKKMDLKIKEWGGMFRVQELSGSGRDEFESFCMEAKNTSGIRSKLVSLSFVGEDGLPMFTPQEIASKCFAGLEVAFKAVKKFNLMDEIEEVEKN